MGATRVAMADMKAAIRVTQLGFGYPGATHYALEDMGMSLERGARCLLCGANGAGKSTLLQILGGKFMVKKEGVAVLGRPPFHDTPLTTSGQLAYLGTTWRRSVGCAGNSVALAADVTAEKMLTGVEGVDPARRDRLVSFLDIDLSWSLMHISDGQRRRVQIAMGLLRPYDVLLLDEITVDLDVVGRLDLLAFLKEECETRQATIVYATHIFDGLEGWLTHLAYVEHGRLTKFGKIEEILESHGVPGSNKLLATVQAWLEEEKEKRLRDGVPEPAAMVTSASPFLSSRQMSYFR